MNRIKCPNCGKDIDLLEKSRWRPFCSERCRMIDLGAWANEAHRIPGKAVPTDEDNQDAEAFSSNPDSS